MSNDIHIIPVAGIGEVVPGEDLSKTIHSVLMKQELKLEDQDIVVVTQKIVSKAEDRVVDLAAVKPSVFAENIAHQYHKDPRHVEVILQQTKRIVRMDHGVLICETRQGFVCANAGVDQSNVKGKDILTLLPVDPDASALKIKEDLQRLFNVKNIAVIISDTWGRPWRNGQVNNTIGSAGILPIVDYVGQQDTYGYELRVSALAVADELAGAAELVMGKIDQIPVALIRGYSFQSSTANAKELIRDKISDLFR